MTMPRKGRFAPQGLLAVDPRAWGMFFTAHEAANERRGDVVLVPIRGPLVHHQDWLCESYDAIKARVLEAIAEQPSAIVMTIDSPGGLVSGCTDTADEIRDACIDAGIPLYAYVDGQATSAAYALACAASRIVIPPTGIVGSLGVIDMLIDATAQDAQMGIATQIVTSGARKADGNPHSPITEEAVGAVRVQVETLATLLFDHVAMARPTTPDEIRALQAALLTGASAVPMLADEVMSLDQMLASIAGGTFAAPSGGAAAGGKTMGAKASKAYEDAIAALRKAAEGDDDEAAKAKRMLAAELEDGDKPDDADKPDDEPGEGASDDAEEPEASDEPDKEAKGTKALAARANKAAAQALAATERLERQQLIASRPDLDESTRELLASSSLDHVKKFLAKTPRRAAPKAASTAVVGGTLAEGLDQDVPPSRPEKASLDALMGVTSAKQRPRVEGNRQIFPAMSRADGAAWLKDREKKRAAQREA